MRKNSKSKPIIWSFEAKNNLEIIFNHVVENFSFKLAVQQTDAILKEVETLSRFPRKGKMSIRFNELRELVVHENTVFYRNNEADIIIASIRPRKTNKKSIR
jgi:plasmid stabilization system protein ParE